MIEKEDKNQFTPKQDIVSLFNSNSPQNIGTFKKLNVTGFSTDERGVFISKGQKIKLKRFKAGDAPTLQALLDDFLIGVTDTIISRTVQLPKPSLAGIGKLYVISDLSGSALTTTISITPYSTELINGDTGTAINTNYGTVRLTTDGTNWFIIN